MERIWLVVVTVIPVLLWTMRNETIFKKRAIALAEVAKAASLACRRQLRAIANALTARRSTRVDGICMRWCVDAMDNLQPRRSTKVTREATLPFDGGARGNPGPGGSEWVLAVKTERCRVE